VQQHRGARGRSQRALRFVQAVAVPGLGASGQADRLVVVEASVVTMTFFTPLASNSTPWKLPIPRPGSPWPPVIDVRLLRSTLNVMLVSVAAQ
jgi:hypothetical protein